MLVIHPFLFVQTLGERDETHFMTIIKQKIWVKVTRTISSLSHFICDLSAEFGMDDIWRVSDRGVFEVVWLLTVLFLLQKKQQSSSLLSFCRFQGKSGQILAFLTKKSTLKIQKNNNEYQHTRYVHVSML